MREQEGIREGKMEYDLPLDGIRPKKVKLG